MHAAEEKHRESQERFKHLCTSVITFPFVPLHIRLKDGKFFNYHQIGADKNMQASQGTGSLIATFDAHDPMQLRSFNDGLKTPLVLGSMPRNKESIAELKEHFGLESYAPIAVHALNVPHECGWGGISTVKENDPNMALFHYPTVDDCAPSLEDVLRLISQLIHRDTGRYALHYVHCTAGRGRSATMITAYIMYCLRQKGIEVTPEQVEAYLKTFRPQVDLKPLQKKFLRAFQDRISPEWGFENMKKEYAQAVQDRSAKCSYDVLAPRMRLHADLYGGMKFVLLVLCCFLYVCLTSAGEQASA